MVLPVRVWGMDSNGKPFTQLAHTLDVTPTGARLGGFRGMLALGDVVGVQYRHQKGRFKVVWVGRPGSSDETHLGIETLDKDKKLWGLDIPEGPRDEYIAPEAKPVTARPGLRTDQRFRVSGEAEITADTGEMVTGNMMDISLSGCYVESGKPLPLHTQVQAKLLIHGTPVELPGVVRTRHPGVGMGVEFVEGGSERELEGLKVILRRLQAAEGEPPRAASKSKPDSNFLSARLASASKELLELDELMKTTPLDPMVLREFRDSLGHVRTTAWAVQRWLELQVNHDDPFPVIKYLNTERIRLAAHMCDSLRDDMKSMELRVQRRELDRLLHAVENLFTHLAGLDVDVAEQQALADSIADSDVVEINVSEETTLVVSSSGPAPRDNGAKPEPDKDEESGEAPEEEAAMEAASSGELFREPGAEESREGYRDRKKKKPRPRDN